MGEPVLAVSCRCSCDHSLGGLKQHKSILFQVMISEAWTKPGVVVLACNPSTQETEVVGSWIQGHSWITQQALSQQNQKEVSVAVHVSKVASTVTNTWKNQPGE
jgi:hypothetical protein